MTAYTSSERYQQCQAIFDRAYPDFRDAGQRYADRIQAALDGQTRLLDIGCGRGSLAHDAIRQAGRSVGIDLMHDDLRHNTTVDAAAVADAGALPFPKASFDLLVSQWVVEHFAHPAEAFRELGRVLKPGGRLILLTTNANNYIPLFSRMVPDRVQRLVIEKLLRRPAHESFPTYFRANTRRAITRLAGDAGFTVESIEYVANPFYLAFNVPLFRLAMLYEQITDRPALRHLKLYLLATLRKQ